MSASNWAVCPRCKHRMLQKVLDAEETVIVQYGQVTIAEWGELKLAAEQARDKFTNLCEGETGANGETLSTFREDYEFYFDTDAEDDPTLIASAVIAKYKGGCDVCNLRLQFKDEHLLEGVLD